MNPRVEWRGDNFVNLLQDDVSATGDYLRARESRVLTEPAATLETHPPSAARGPRAVSELHAARISLCVSVSLRLTD